MNPGHPPSAAPPAEPVPWWRILLVGRHPRRTLMRIVILILVCFLGRQFALLPIRVQSISMLPTCVEGQIRFINRLAYLRNPPQRGDIVGIRLAGPNVMYLKRVVGLPGETVAFRHGKLLVDGEVIDEPYLKLPSEWNMETIRVAPDAYYVVGDNRSMAIADHTKGQAERKRILGKLWP